MTRSSSVTTCKPSSSACATSIRSNAPPSGDRWGPGTRIPAIIISPYAKKGYVDHQAYDTTSVLKFISKRFNLEALPGFAGRPNAGDLTNAFDFSQTP